MRRIRSSSALLVLLGLLITACTSASGEETSVPSSQSGKEGDIPAVDLDPCAKPNLTTVEPGALTFATSSVPAPPYFLTDEPADRLGFEADLAYVLAEVLGFRPGEVTWEFVPRAQIESGEFTQFDVAVGGFTGDDSAFLAYSRPYLEIDLAVVSDSPAAVAELAGPRDDQSGDSEATRLQWAGRGHDPERLGLLGPATLGDVVPYDGADQLLSDSSIRRSVDVIIADNWVTAWLTDIAEDRSLIDVGIDAGATNYVMAVVAGNPLASCVDRALEEMSENGSLAQLRSRWSDPAQWRED